MKLKMFKEAELELKQFDDFNRAEFFYQSQPGLYSNRKGSMVPFGLRLLNVEIAQYLGRPDVTLNSLYAFLNRVDEIVKHSLPNKEGIYIYSDLFNRFSFIRETVTNKIFSKETRRIWNERRNKVLFSISNTLLNKRVRKLCLLFI